MTLLAAQARQTIFEKSAAGGLVSVESAPGGRFALCLSFRIPLTVEPWQGHLAEHLLMAGKDGTLTARLQAYDISAQGYTTRNQVSLILEGPSGAVNEAVIAVGEMCEVRSFAVPALVHETKILREEQSLRPSYQADLDAIWLLAGGRGALFPAETGEAPAELPKSLVQQGGAACAAVLDGDTKPVVDALLALMTRWPAGPKSWTDPKIEPNGSNESMVVVKVGPVGTPSMLAGAAAGFSLSSLVGPGTVVIDLDCGPSLVAVVAEKRLLNSGVLNQAAQGAPSFAKKLADSWTGDPGTWVRVKAVSLLAGERLRKSDIANIVEVLQPEDYAAALEKLAGK